MFVLFAISLKTVGNPGKEGEWTMNFDFDKVIDRKNTNSIKWDFTEKFFGEADVLPMWVADMDFEAPPQVTEALLQRVKHGIYGYSGFTDSYYQAVVDWMQKRHEWTVERDWISYCPGIVPALYWAVRAFTRPGDKVVLQSPVYPPFYAAIERHGCEVVNNPLKLTEGCYSMDFEDLEQKLADEAVKMLILCSPHNPVGRVWTREELARLAELCRQHNVIVVSDEIHADIIYTGHKHVPLASLSEEIAQISIICTSPAKTFNLAGLQTSNIIIPNKDLRTGFNQVMEDNGMHLPTIFGVKGLEAAYQYGEQWLEELLVYLQGNLEYLEHFIEEKIPRVKVVRPQGTYLVWLDMRELGLNDEELQKLLVQKARVALNSGAGFGQGGEGFARINIGCPRSVLVEGLRRIERALINV